MTFNALLDLASAGPTNCPTTLPSTHSISATLASLLFFPHVKHTSISEGAAPST